MGSHLHDYFRIFSLILKPNFSIKKKIIRLKMGIVRKPGKLQTRVSAS